MTALLQFFISYAMAMLAFWVLEVSTFIFILFAFEYIASGHLFPMDILPPALAKRFFSRRSRIRLYFPVSIYMGQITGNNLLQGLLVQALWVVAALLCALRLVSRHQKIRGGGRMNMDLQLLILDCGLPTSIHHPNTPFFPAHGNR